MNRKDGATVKRDRLEAMHTFLLLPDVLPNEKDWIVARFEYKMGLTQKKIKEYLEVLERMRFISFQGNRILEFVSESAEESE